MQSNKQVGTTPEFDPLARLIAALEKEGFTALDEDDDAAAFGEKVYRRQERFLFVQGDTIFVVIESPRLDERTLRQAIEGQTNLFRAHAPTDKALSIFQSKTIYLCFVTREEMPMTINLEKFITTAGGFVLIPVIIVPEINQVLYPVLVEKTGSAPPRVEYLQYLLGERVEPVNIHRGTVRAFWVACIVVAVIAVAIGFGATL